MALRVRQLPRGAGNCATSHIAPAATPTLMRTLMRTRTRHSHRKPHPPPG
jgi:hypothetical protein